ncbi:hypothetical protein IMSHALPRED_004297 [Imshaugia aleurites]|uniref:Coatomer subunit epsilon n=1 Tax=Imshaugia aleurites TaxID=172621 RepID=A0A8H3ILU9_9LECA|nr:hypothetical protein IMSHALPRED_004297 [Imshaugia aleurites]
MDPFSAEGELLNIHNAFHQGQYLTVIDFDISSLSTENKIPARVLQLRAQIAVGQAKEVLANIGKEGNAPDFAAVKVFAQYVSGSTSNAISEIATLVEAESENTTVQLLGGTVLQAAEKTEEALSLLGKHQGSLEAYEIRSFLHTTRPDADKALLHRIALIVQIHLQQNRTDLALKEVQAARKWAQDSLLVNIAESWVGLRMGGERYQQAFYVFEELAQAPSTSATKSLVGQAVAELHLGRFPEAEAALQQAIQKDPSDIEAIANSVVLKVISGKDTSEHTSNLEAIAPEHPLLVDLQEKSSFFDQAAGKYSAKVAS